MSIQSANAILARAHEIQRDENASLGRIKEQNELILQALQTLINHLMQNQG